MEKFSMFFNDVVELARVLDLTDMAVPLGFLVWAVIILLPLHKIDRRCRTTMVVYVMFCVSAGITLIIVLPQAYIRSMPIQTQIVVAVVMTACAILRWNVRFSELGKRKRAQDKDFADTTEDLHHGGHKGVPYAK